MPAAVQEINFQPQEGPQTAFLQSKADIAVYGGARGGGKSFGLLLDKLRYVQNPRYGGVIFRRTNPQIFQEGGLWDTSELIYPYAGAVGSRGTGTWRFPSGATVQFRHMENESDRFAWLGAQIPTIDFDELVTFTEKQFFFMLGSNRDPSGSIRPTIRATTNPEADTWLARLLDYWWDQETGYPIEERSGRVRYFVRVDDLIIWGDTAEELKARFPGAQPKSFTFILARVQDNKILMEKDPTYLSSLMAQGKVDRERYLKGNWKIKVSAGLMFKREWVKYVDQAPLNNQVRRFRRWDLASTEPKKANDPDYTAGVLLLDDRGVFYVEDVQRIQGTPKTVEDLIKETARRDGVNVAIRMEEEGGSSGKTVIDHYARNVLAGFNFLGVRSTGDKVVRAKPVSTAMENGNILLVRGKWNKDFVDEIEAFPEGRYDDQVDAFSGAHNDLTASGTASAEVVDHQRSERYAGRQRLII